MLWNPLQPRGIQRNPQSEVYAPDAWTDGDLRFRWTPEAGGVLEVAGIPGRPLPYQMSCPSPSEGRRWTLTLAGMLRQGRLPPEGVFRASGPLPPPGSTDGRGGIVVGMYKGEGGDLKPGEKWITIRGRHVVIDGDGNITKGGRGLGLKALHPRVAETHRKDADLRKWSEEHGGIRREDGSTILYGARRKKEAAGWMEDPSHDIHAYTDELHAHAAKNLGVEQERTRQRKEEETYEAQGIHPEPGVPLSRYRGKKLWLYHGTSDKFVDDIKKNGIRFAGHRSNVGRDAYGPSRKKVAFLTSDSGHNPGGAMQYAVQAAAKHGGNPIVVRVLVDPSEVRFDSDDADIRSGRNQYIAESVDPESIREIGGERVQMKKGRSIITILFKGKRITGPVAFLTNKEDGHVFPVSASDPKAIAAMNTPRHREIVEKIHAETTDPKKKAVHAEHLATLDRLAGASEHPADKRFGELLAEGKVADEDREHFRKFYDKFDNQKNIPAGTRANMTAMYYETQAHRRERDERTRKEQAELARMAAEREQRIRERREEIARIQADASAAIKKITGDRDVAQLDESEIQRAMKIAKDANLTQQEGSFRGEIVRRDKEEKAKTEALGQEARALALRADIANAKEVGHRVQEKNGNLFVEDRPGAFSQGAIVSVNGKAHRVDGAGQAYSRIEGPRSHEPGEMAFRRGEEGSRRSGREADGYTVGQMIRDRRSGKWFRVTSTHSEYIPSDGMSFGYGFDRGWAHNAIARPATEEESAPHEQRHQAQQDKKTALSDLKALHANLKGETEGETNKIVADTQQHERIKIPTERALGGPLTEGEFRIGPDTITAYHPGYYDDYTETARQVKRTPELEDKIRQLHAKATQEIPTGRIDLPDMKGKPYHAEGQRQRFYLKPVETDAPASRQEGPRDSQPAGSAAMEPTPHDDTVMRFGKHSGRTLKQVADTDPGYLRWAAENLSNEPLRKKAQAVYQRHVMRKGRAIKSRQIVVMFKGDVASMEPLTTGSYSPGPAPRSGRRRFITEDDVRARARELSVRQRSREFIQRIHDGTQDPAKKAAHAARLEAYGPALAPPPGRQRKEKPFTGSITFQGIPIAIESEKGTWREGVGRDGKPWRVKMNAHYGEIHGWGTLGTDGDKLDAYVGPVADASHAYVIDQLHPDSGAFDEQKVMLGFPSESAAKAAYLAQFDKPGFYGGIHPIPMDVLKAKLRDKALRGQPISHGRPVVILSKGRAAGSPSGFLTNEDGNVFPVFGNKYRPRDTAKHRAIVQKIHDGTRDPKKKRAHAASLQALAETQPQEQGVVNKAASPYTDALEQHQAAARKRGLTWKAYTATDEYAAALPELQRLHKEQRSASPGTANADVAQRREAMQKHGVAVGDRVSFHFGGLLGHMVHGTVQDGGKGPTVKLDDPIHLSKNGRVTPRLEIPWSPSMKKAETRAVPEDARPGASQAPLQPAAKPEMSAKPRESSTWTKAAFTRKMSTHSGDVYEESADGDVRGHFGVHHEDGRHVITHIPSGMKIDTYRKREDAKGAVDALMQDESLDWSFKDQSGLTRRHTDAWHASRN